MKKCIIASEYLANKLLQVPKLQNFESTRHFKTEIFSNTHQKHKYNFLSMLYLLIENFHTINVMYQP